MASRPESNPSAKPPVCVWGLDLHPLRGDECVGAILAALDAGRGGWVFTPNLDHLRRYRRDDDFRRTVASATITIADGMPLVWAARIAGTPLPGRACGSDLIRPLAAAAAAAGRSLFLLGADARTLDQAAAVLREDTIGLDLVGLWAPPRADAAAIAADEQLRAHLAAAAPDIVLVALGSPKQEQVIAALRADLPGTWWLGIGAGLAFLAGTTPRAPGWLRAVGGEWVFRLVLEPRRLARRYLVDGLPCFGRLLAWAVAARRRQR